MMRKITWKCPGCGEIDRACLVQTGITTSLPVRGVTEYEEHGMTLYDIEYGEEEMLECDQTRHFKCERCGHVISSGESFVPDNEFLKIVKDHLSEEEYDCEEKYTLPASGIDREYAFKEAVNSSYPNRNFVEGGAAYIGCEGYLVNALKVGFCGGDKQRHLSWYNLDGTISVLETSYDEEGLRPELSLYSSLECYAVDVSWEDWQIQGIINEALRKKVEEIEKQRG
ncbi:MAG: hypothetical protein Q8M92_04275 [Candidatus Subteraquimicrobiales bacterium]|nr:hypothetical protein [Candidatus Subteraquimicrobiales bacterium]